ncbi:lysophosphatidic acid receptor 6-like isoform X1 [Notolabrus celidotus]|uniref:lysophosphatidic acid receptor 6-like isoform X1 n=1 Tax=Notolabrus celidotus TaxID=1203425 RepID=UPI001490696B|nr:lysophosphatidic acid receptor 6-like isoform X1 [Notolabrus celidotus]
MNNTLEEEHEPRLVYAVIFACIIVLGLPLNALSLWTLIRQHSLKSPSAVYMVNLAISDLLLVISLPMRVYFYATGIWPLGDFACNLITVFFRNNIRSSIFFITFISVDRLLAVVYPLRSRHLRTSSNACKAAAAVWLLVLVMSVPESMSFLKFLNNLTESSCFEMAHVQNQNQSPDILMQLVQPMIVFGMLAVNIVCTALVSWTLNKHLNDSARVNNKALVFFGSISVTQPAAPQS